MNEKSWLNEDLANDIEGVSAEDVRQFYPHILAQGLVKVLVHGNLYKKDALEISDLAQKKLKLRKLPAIKGLDNGRHMLLGNADGNLPVHTSRCWNSTITR
jgi:secreted Zn-dependent insulinase-like peptidase